MDAKSSWDWSSISGETSGASAIRPETEARQRQTQPEPPQARSKQGQPEPGAREKRSTPQYGPRTCRICLDTVNPTFPTNISSSLGIASTSSKPQYISDDPELGRLLSPCKCKGSQKYVHEGCLNAWRLSNPMAERNFWQCPTCKYTYRMTRLRWASMLSNKVTQGFLTVIIMILSLFILGFVADPLVDLWFDPVGTIGDTVSSVITDVEATGPPLYEDAPSWSDHFVKGFFSLGLIGLAKSMLAIGPWHWLNMRTFFGGRRRDTGRARAENLSLIFVLIGAFTFLMAIWKAVRALSGRILARMEDNILDIDEDSTPTPEDTTAS